MTARAGDAGRARTIYRYGWIAWVWRGLALFGLAASALLVFAALRSASWMFIAMALPLAVPAIVLPWMLAVRIDRVGDDAIVVTNLFFVRRHVSRRALGRPRFRDTAESEGVQFHAPRAWIPVRGGLPIYVDLLAKISDERAFRSFFRLPSS